MISVCLLTWNNHAKVARCFESLRSVFDRPGVGEILVLDNGSTDGTLAWLREYRHPKYTLHTSGVNLGVASGRDKLFSLARGEYILSLDSDVEDVSCGLFLDRMLYAGKFNKQIGIAGVRGGYVLSDWTWTACYPQDYYGYAPLVCGYCQLFKRDVLDVCKINTAYSPFWLEDSDFCMQINHKLGLKGFVVGESGLRHSWDEDKQKAPEKWELFRGLWKPPG